MTGRITAGDAPHLPVLHLPVLHLPVLLAEVLTSLHIVGGGRYLDGTFGAGGYTRAILDAEPDTRVLALDRDRTAIAAGYPLVEAMGGRLTLSEAEFAELDREAEAFAMVPLDGVVLDIGVSSMQLDQPSRGFSFRQDGPLDMRMGQDGESAADILNTRDETEIADILYHFGEERRSRAIARAIVAARAEAPITTTLRLASIIAKVVHPRPGQIHPATRSFQALRIAVNDELGQLVRALVAAERVLKSGGTLAVVTFHSLEDRIVKQFFVERSGRGAGASRFQPDRPSEEPRFDCPGKWPITPGQNECAANPRARSAKLRAGIRTSAPASGASAALARLAALPQTRSPR